ncbi:MAG: D-amino-acid transaminase [Candidatus Puniceispirillaceae bacterium]
MSRIAYVNGSYIPHHEAAVSIDDRGYQFGDGVYEVVYIIDGHLADEDAHLDRLERSLSELSMSMPLERSVLQMIMARIIRLNNVRTGLVYLQITRGVARRDHKWSQALKPSLVVTAKNTMTKVPSEVAAVPVISTSDERWDRRDIKTIQLLPNCLAKQKAYEAGAYEALMIDRDGFITEGSSSNAWIVTQNGTLVTRPPTHDILNGITRRTVMAVAQELQLSIEERAFTIEEAKQAAEAFLTSASSHVTAIGSIDGDLIHDGKAGQVAKRLRLAYIEDVTSSH